MTQITRKYIYIYIIVSALRTRTWRRGADACDGRTSDCQRMCEIDFLSRCYSETGGWKGRHIYFQCLLSSVLSLQVDLMKSVAWKNIWHQEDLSADSVTDLRRLILQETTISFRRKSKGRFLAAPLLRWPKTNGIYMHIHCNDVPRFRRMYRCCKQKQKSTIYNERKCTVYQPFGLRITINQQLTFRLYTSTISLTVTSRLKTDPVRTPKLSNTDPSRYLDEWPLGSTILDVRVV